MSESLPTKRYQKTFSRRPPTQPVLYQNPKAIIIDCTKASGGRTADNVVLYSAHIGALLAGSAKQLLCHLILFLFFQSQRCVLSFVWREFYKLVYVVFATRLLQIWRL